MDLEFIRSNKEKVKKAIDTKYFKQKKSGLIDDLLKIDSQRKKLLKEVENLRAIQNKASKKIGDKSISQAEKKKLINQMASVKKDLTVLEKELKKVDSIYKKIIWQIPNMPDKDAPIGKDDNDNIEIRHWGKIPKFLFEPKDHLTLAQGLDLVDFEAGKKIVGSKFYFLKNQGVDLTLAIFNYVFDILKKEKFTTFISPELAKTEIVEAIGFQPRGAEKQIYEIEDENLSLIATAEITLGGMHKDDVLTYDKLPLKYAGLSNCYRVEAGSWGKYSHGLYRVHHFHKIEMFIYCQPEESKKNHEYIVKLEEKIFQGLGIPYRVMDVCTGELGAPYTRKYDLEGWMPGRGEKGDWGEITSASNATDYQAQRLNIRFKDKDGKNKHPHMLNGTAIPISRALICILENYQQKDGTIKVPKALESYMKTKVIK